ncbi:hypothetical protein FNV43_RR21846 [Rhamnella rubrinervis]|uniref:Protein kinase domain-containing protein n=1 Tax=Rhamnella rubrinervis TaxID=2594499 RepID=A0A8K0DTZ9_9ROSA|nr:hypothetical protein FNV43_RR21846 [Rhamnella rubrinervis]
MSRNLRKLIQLGRGSYGTVHLDVPISPPFSTKACAAVKSSMLEHSSTLQKEDRVLQWLSSCPEMVHCYGNEQSFENGPRVYNLLLEYASGGSLFDMIQSYGGSIPEQKVKIYTRMILKSLCCIHQKGNVHCDLKPENILVFVNDHGVKQLKIVDFGLTKEPGREEETSRFRFRGTPLYMSPESFVFGEVEAGLDIWSLGCIVMMMICGKLPWSGLKRDSFVRWLALSNEEPELYLPQNMSENAKDFLRKCLVRDPRKRWTAKMLLNHPFAVEGHILS